MNSHNESGGFVMSDLAEFLLARIAEDEEAARTSRPHEHTHGYNSSQLTVKGPDPYGAITITSGRVLAECEAKRDLIEWANGVDYLVEVGDPAAPRDKLGEQVLRIIAEPYSNHPDYRAEWRSE